MSLSRPSSAASVKPKSKPSSRPFAVISSGSSGSHDHEHDHDAAILAPVRPATLNRPIVDRGSPGSRKRKRNLSVQSPPADHLLKAPVVLKSHPAKLTAKPHILHPLMLLPRDNLPLSTLDLSLPNGDFTSSRFYESTIKILDLEGRLGSNVLLARSETSRAVYAIEREDGGLYVLCKLGGWVDIERLSQSATVVCSERVKTYRPVRKDSLTAPPLVTPQMHKENKQRRMCIEEIQSMVKRRSVAGRESLSRPSTPATAAPTSETLTGQGAEPSQPAPDMPVESTPVSALGIFQEQASLPDVPGEPAAQLTSDDIFQNIRVQYSEALYHSMVCDVCPPSLFSSLTPSRVRSPILQKGHSLGLELPSTWIATPTLKWLI
jgi:DNA replication regulator SLD3